MVQTTARSPAGIKPDHGPFCPTDHLRLRRSTHVPTRVAVLVGSLRADSVNRKLAELLRDQAPDGVTLDLVEGLDRLPFYNEDIDNGPTCPPRPRRCASGSPARTASWP